MDKAALLDIAVRLDRLAKVLRKEAEKKDICWNEAFFVGCQIAATERLLQLIRLRFSLYPPKESDDAVYEH